MPGAFLLGMDVNEAGTLYAAGYIPSGRLLTLSTQTGTLASTISGAATLLGNAPSVAVDTSHGEILVANTAGSTFPRVLSFDTTGPGGNVAPKRVLGASGSTAAGGWAVAYDRTRDQILTTCNCNNQIMIFPRTATGAAAPTRVLTLSSDVTGVYSLLSDDGGDTVWAVIAAGGTTSVIELVELPRGATGTVAPTHAPITLQSRGHLARCN
jgi:hypothetical protein